MKSNEIKQYTPLLIELLKRDIKVKYRKSVLGVLWSVLNPHFYDDNIVRCFFQLSSKIMLKITRHIFSAGS